MEKKFYVLDTNVLGHDPKSIFAFEDNTVIIPEAVIDELDNNKTAPGEFGFNVRESIRELEKLKENGKLTNGVRINETGSLKVESNHVSIDLPSSWRDNKADDRILQVCKGIQKEGKNEVYLITKDILLRIKAEILDIQAQDYLTDSVTDVEKQYKGRRELFVNKDTLDKFYFDSSLIPEEEKFFDEKGNLFNIEKLTENEFITLKTIGGIGSALSQYNKGLIKSLHKENFNPYGVKARNASQHFVIEALCKPVDEVPLVILKGPAGTAKTFLSLAYGLESVYNINVGQEKLYRKILICRPNILMDDDLGYLPGSESEKIAPLMRPIYDNLEVLIDSDSKQRYKDENILNSKIETLFLSGIIETQAVGYLRGRSINNTLIIIDEAQNVTPKAMKGIMSRAGEGTKIILCGDPEQVDHPYLSERVNGLSYASEKMKGSQYCAQVTFRKEEGQRSPLAKEITERL